MRGEIVTEVRKELTEVSNLLARADSLNRKELAEKIMLAIDSVIRPLSHRLGGFGLDLSETATLVPSDLQPSKPGVAWSRLAGPEIFLAAFMLFIVPATFIVGGVSNGILVILVALAETVALVLVERLAVGFVVNRVIGLFLNLTLSSAFGALFLLLSSGDSMPGVAIGFFTISLASTTLLALVSKRIDTLNDLEFVRAQITNLVVRLGQEVWVTKTRLAKAIHGSVQAKFLAIALKLKNSGSESALAEAKQDVLEATAAVDASLESNKLSLDAQLNSYREAWAGALDLDFKISPEAAEKVDLDPIARACVAEVIGEAIANAAKHSNAKNVQIDLISEPGLVRVSVGSQGSLVLTESKSGYGSLILDQVSNSWVLRESDGKVILEATFLLAK
jgi:signal transduction histidine kinase